MYTVSRNDVKTLAAKVEYLSKEIQDKIDNGGDYITAANELVRNTMTLTFTLGEVTAFEQSGRKVKAMTSSNPNRTPRTYARDSRGRFACGRFSRV